MLWALPAAELGAVGRARPSDRFEPEMFAIFPVIGPVWELVRYRDYVYAYGSELIIIRYFVKVGNCWLTNAGSCENVGLSAPRGFLWGRRPR
jgi:hypothetical protein